MTALADFGVSFAGIAFGAACALWVNFFLQRKLLHANNREKAIDFLVGGVRELEELYIAHWGEPQNSTPISALEIKRRQTQFNDLHEFSCEKYRLQDSGADQLETFIVLVGDQQFATPGNQPDLNRCSEISKRAGKLMLALMQNKI